MRVKLRVFVAFGNCDHHHNTNANFTLLCIEKVSIKGTRPKVPPCGNEDVAHLAIQVSKENQYGTIGC